MNELDEGVPNPCLNPWSLESPAPRVFHLLGCHRAPWIASSFGSVLHQDYLLLALRLLEPTPQFVVPRSLGHTTSCAFGTHASWVPHGPWSVFSRVPLQHGSHVLLEVPRIHFLIITTERRGLHNWGHMTPGKGTHTNWDHVVEVKHIAVSNTLRRRERLWINMGCKRRC